MNRKDDKKLLQWHPAFYAGLQIEFGKESAKLIFEREHNLSTKPMQIDVLVIKKCTDDVIHKNIGRIFRKYNIIEYKSPKDYLSIDDFYKVYGYTCFYKSASDKENSVKVEELTITFVCKSFPEKFVNHIKEIRGLTIEKKGAGIYYIDKDIIPMQLLIISEFLEDENLWLRSLTDDLQSIEIIDKLSSDYSLHQHDELYKSMMNVIIRANKEKFKEVTSMCEALKELWAEDIEKSRNDGICRAIKSCRALGGTKEQVQTVLADNYDITEEQAQEYIELYW